MFQSLSRQELELRLRVKQKRDEDRAEREARKATEPPPTPDISLADYIREAWPILEPKVPYRHNWHIDAMCEHLEAVSSGEIQYLLINIPPRFMKSLTVCVFWPTWEWTWWPESRWLTSSYGGGLATRDALKSRRLIQSPWYQKNWGNVFHLTGDQNQKTRYENNRTGYRIATSVGGTGTGEGGDRIIVDDPMKEVDAYSDTRREAVNDWWDGTMSTRANDPDTAAWVIICQRLHERDLPGYIMEKMERGEEEYELLIIPAEYEETTRVTSLGWQDPRTEPGELLWPDRFDRPWVDRQKQKLGSRKAAAQLQQRPAPAEGAIFKKRWWRFWQPAGLNLPPIRVRLEDGSQFEPIVIELPDELEEQLQSWDMTFKDLKENDYVCGQVWGKKAADRFLLDQVRDHLDIVATIKAVRALAANWPRALAKLIEAKANGPAVVQLLQHEIAGLIEVEPQGGKVSRANAVAPIVESGNVYLPHPHVAPWVWEYIDELTAFPAGAHDDMVDATSQALVRWLPRADEKPASAAGRVLTSQQIGF